MAIGLLLPHPPSDVEIGIASGIASPSACGQAMIRTFAKQLRAEATKQAFDPNVLKDNVEVIAAECIGPETVNYVSKIHEYYFAYKINRIAGRAAP